MSGHCGVIDTEPLALTLSSIYLFRMLHVTWINIEACRSHQSWTALLKGRFNLLIRNVSGLVVFNGAVMCTYVCALFLHHTQTDWSKRVVTMETWPGVSVSVCSVVVDWADLKAADLWAAQRPLWAHAAVINCSVLLTSASLILLIADWLSLDFSNGIDQTGSCPCLELINVLNLTILLRSLIV